MKKKLIIFISIFVVFASVITAFAASRFFLNIDKENSFTLSFTDSSYVDVSDHNSLIEYTNHYAYSDKYNDKSATTSYNRMKFTIRLNSDIKLSNNLLISSDCHVDLNGKTLDLNGYNLNIKNSYYGTMLITNGTIIDSSEDKSSVINVDVPNGYVLIGATSSLTVNEINESTEAQAYTVLKYVLASIANEGLNSFYNSILTSTNIAGSNHCTMCSEADKTSSHGCIYTSSDLDLVDHYFGYSNIKIEYSVPDNNNYLDVNGKVTLDSTSSKLVKLGIKITVDETSYNYSVNVHVVHSSDYNKATVNALVQALEIYYNSTTSKYEFQSGVILPLKNFYFNTNIKYRITVKGNTSYESDSKTPNIYFGDPYGEVSFDNYVLANIDDLVEKIEIISDSVTYELPTASSSGTVIVDNYSFALRLLRNSILDGELKIAVTKDSSGYQGYSIKDLISNTTTLGVNSKIDSISYKLVNDITNVYELIDITNGKKLRVVDSNNPPMITQNVVVQASFEFKEADNTGNKNIVINIPVIYTTSSTDPGVGFDAFSPYYAYFNIQFNSATSGYTYNSFKMPLSYGTSFPSYQFLPYTLNAEGNYELVTSKLFTINTSVDNFDFEGAINTQSDTIVTINPYYINSEDTEYIFLYIPVWNGSYQFGDVLKDDSIKKYSDFKNSNVFKTITKENMEGYQFKSSVMIKGITMYNNGIVNTDNIPCDFDDENLYHIVYHSIYDNQTTTHPTCGYVSYVDNRDNFNATYITTNSLNNYVEAIKLTTLLTNYSYNNLISLKGLEKLSNIKELDISSTTAFNVLRQIDTLKEIKSLKILNLSSCNIYDQEKETPLGFPDGTNNQFLQNLSNLSNLERLDLSNNSFYQFNGLEDFAGLKWVDPTNNNHKSTFFTDILKVFPAFDNLVTELLNDIYGSNGLVNVGIFASLVGKGVEVVGYDIDKTETNINVSAVSNIAYQKYVDKNFDIKNITSNISTNLSDYGIVPDNDKPMADQSDTGWSVKFTNAEMEVDSSDNTFSVSISYKYIVKVPLKDDVTINIPYKCTYNVIRI